MPTTSYKSVPSVPPSLARRAGVSHCRDCKQQLAPLIRWLRPLVSMKWVHPKLAGRTLWALRMSVVLLTSMPSVAWMLGARVLEVEEAKAEAEEPHSSDVSQVRTTCRPMPSTSLGPARCHSQHSSVLRRTDRVPVS
jgi:hypothetical protein